MTEAFGTQAASSAVTVLAKAWITLCCWVSCSGPAVVTMHAIHSPWYRSWLWHAERNGLLDGEEQLGQGMGNFWGSQVLRSVLWWFVCRIGAWMATS